MVPSYAGGSPPKRAGRMPGGLRHQSSMSNIQTGNGLGISGVSTPSLRRPASSMSIRSPTPSLYARRPTTPSLYSGNSSSATSLTATNSFGITGNTSTYTGNIKVSVRMKPSRVSLHSARPQSALSSRAEEDWDVDPIRNAITGKESGEFTFDKVYDGLGTRNCDVYRESVQELVEKVMEGFNGTVFAYGMTGSGKTHSMQGSAQDPGIIPSSAQSIFEHIDSHRTERNFTIKCGYLEIYNEHINDLLAGDTNGSAEIRLRDDSLRGVRAIGLTEWPVKSADDLLSIIEQGDSLRKTEGTEFNARSSRSHAVVQISVESSSKRNGNKLSSTLYLCDLAGSERAVSQSERRKEGAYINKSLLTLGTVISKLSSGELGHVPYRDSKLTRLLQPALSGNSLVSVLCTIQQTSGSYVETLSTLRFAARAKNIVVSVKRNDDTSVADARTIEKLTHQVSQLKQENEELKARRPDNAAAQRLLQLEVENRMLNEKVEHLTRLVDDSRLEEVLGVENNEENGEQSVNRALLQQIEEYKSFVPHLEKQVRSLQMTLAETTLQSQQQQGISPLMPSGQYAMAGQSSSSSPTSPLLSSCASSGLYNGSGSYHLQQKIKDLQERVQEMDETGRDKDRIIAGLRAALKRKDNMTYGYGMNGSQTMSEQREYLKENNRYLAKEPGKTDNIEG